MKTYTRISDAHVEGGDFGIKVHRPVHLTKFSSDNSDVGLFLGEGSSGSVVIGGYVSGSRVGIQVGGNPAIDRVLSRLTDRFPELEGVDRQLLQSAINEMQAVTHEDEAESKLKQSGLGHWLKQQSFVSWASLAVSLLTLAKG
jgi:hypothetical protein